MTNQLTRIQVYVEPDNLALVDEIARDIKIKRSQIIRDALDAVVNNYIRTKLLIKPSSSKKNALIEMGGIAVSKTGTVGLNVDEIYLND